MKIQVIEEDIKAGTLESGLCPVALALRRQTGLRWHVSRHVMVDSSFRDARRFKAPLNVYYFVYNFDRGHSVKPFQFELPI